MEGGGESGVIPFRFSEVAYPLEILPGTPGLLQLELYRFRELPFCFPSNLAAYSASCNPLTQVMLGGGSSEVTRHIVISSVSCPKQNCIYKCFLFTRIQPTHGSISFQQKYPQYHTHLYIILVRFWEDLGNHTHPINSIFLRLSVLRYKTGVLIVPTPQGGNEDKIIIFIITLVFVFPLPPPLLTTISSKLLFLGAGSF